MQQLEGLLAKAEGRILLSDHEFSDPDGFASKCAWAYILRERFGLQTEIVYSKAIGNNTTRALMTKFSELYGRKMTKIEEVTLNDFQLVFLVDVNLTSSNLPFTPGQRENLDYSKVIVIDHHEANYHMESDGCKPPRHGLFEDITEEGIGSASTRTIEYLKYFGLRLSADNAEHSLLSTALLIGIETDCRGKLPSKRDKEAELYIIDSASRQIKNEIDRRPRAEQAQRALGHAIATYDQLGPYAVATLGRIEPDNKDIIAITAEELLMGQGIEASIAWALVENMAIGSIRTKEESQLSAKKIVNLYNDNALFNGGGRPNAAGFHGQLDKLRETVNEPDDEASLIKLLHNNVILKRIIDYLKN